MTSKLTPEVHRRIVRAVRGGNYEKVAARNAGITSPTYYDWLRRGEHEQSGKYRDLLEAVQEAKAAAEAEAACMTDHEFNEQLSALLDKVDMLIETAKDETKELTAYEN
jgi:transposase-like protein